MKEVSEGRGVMEEGRGVRVAGGGGEGGEMRCAEGEVSDVG